MKKIIVILFSLMMLLSVQTAMAGFNSTVNSTLTPKLQHFYNMSGTGTALIDIVGSVDATIDGGIWQASPEELDYQIYLNSSSNEIQSSLLMIRSPNNYTIAVCHNMTKPSNYFIGSSQSGTPRALIATQDTVMIGNGVGWASAFPAIVTPYNKTVCSFIIHYPDNYVAYYKYDRDLNGGSAGLSSLAFPISFGALSNFGFGGIWDTLTGSYEGNDVFIGSIKLIQTFDGTLSVDEMQYITTNFDWYGLLAPVPPAPPAIEWDSLPEYDGSYHNHDLEMQYNLTTASTANCTLYFNGSVADSDVNLSTGVHTLVYNATGSEPANVSFQLYVECVSQYGGTNSTTKSIYLDFINPLLHVYSPLNNTGYYIVTGVPVLASFENINLNMTGLEVYDSNGTLKFNDTRYPATSNQTYSYTINSSDLVLGDEMLFHFHLEDHAMNHVEENYTVKILNCAEAVEDWTAQYTVCNTTDEQVMYYTDANSCDTYFDFPIDNGTENSCNYCTSTWAYTVGECLQHAQDKDYAYSNTCCSDTGLPSDCNIPENQTGVYCVGGVGFHTASDVPAVAIDGLVEIGITAVQLAPLVAILTLLVVLL